MQPQQSIHRRFGVWLTVVLSVSVVRQVNSGRVFTFDPTFDLTPIAIRRQVVWRSMVDWHDPQCWQPDHRTPCARDRVSLPEDYVLFLNHQLDTSELVLPQNGELILGPKGGLRLITDADDDFHDASSPPANCPPTGANLEFHPFGGHPTTWHSPRNWHVVYRTPSPSDYRPLQQMRDEWTLWTPLSNYATFVSTPARGWSLVPHSERIPCTGDWVHFPVTNGSFKVTIDRSSQLPVLGSLTVGDTRFGSGSQFAEFARSFRGAMLFHIRDYNHVQIASPAQTLADGCGNDAPRKLATICAEVDCSAEPTLQCADPIRPIGHCCPVCAASLVVARQTASSSSGSSGSSGSVSDLAVYSAVFAALRELHHTTPEVRLYGHWLYDGRFQVLVDHLRVGQESTGDQYVRELRRLIDENYYLKHKVQLSVYSSVQWFDHSGVVSPVVWFFVVLFVLSMVSVPLYAYYQRNRLDPAFTFVRFRSATSDIELEPAGNGNDGSGSGNGISMFASSAHAFPRPPMGDVFATPSKYLGTAVAATAATLSGTTTTSSSIGSVRSIMTGSTETTSTIGGGGGSNVSLLSESLFPVASLVTSGPTTTTTESDKPGPLEEEDKVTSEHFDNVFRNLSNVFSSDTTTNPTRNSTGFQGWSE